MTTVSLTHSRTPTDIHLAFIKTVCGVEVVDKCCLSLVLLKQEGTKRILVNQSNAEVESYLCVVLCNCQ